MCNHYQRYLNQHHKEAILSAGRYLRDVALQSLPGKTDMLAVISDPKKNKTSKKRIAKLGGSGLGLVALLCIEEFEPGFTSPDSLRQLGNFILSMQKENGSFYSKYYPDKQRINSKWTSLYYPGEAALGLIMLQQLDTDDSWAEAAKAVLRYLADIRREKNNIPADHWALLATATLFQNHEISNEERDILTKHALQIAKVITDSQLLGPVPTTIIRVPKWARVPKRNEKENLYSITKPWLFQIKFNHQKSHQWMQHNPANVLG